MYLLEGKGKIKLQKFLSDATKLGIVAVGNSLRNDDGVALFLGKSLKKNFEHVYITEQAPENFIYKLLKEEYTHILIVDAAEMNLSPGRSAVIQKEALMGGKIMTHSIPISFFSHLMEILEVSVLILGIQPKDRSFGQSLTPEVKKGAEKVRKIILHSLTS